MNTLRVKELIAAPSSVTAEDRPGLVGLVERYPHVSGLALLLARSSQLAGHIDQQRDLLRAAAMLEQRDALFDLMVRPEILKEAREQWEETGSELRSETETELRSETETETETGTGTGTEAELRSEKGTELRGMEREVLLSAIESTIERDVMEWEKQGVGTETETGTETESELRSQTDGASEKREGTGTETEVELGSELDGGDEEQGTYSAWLRARARAVEFGTAGKSEPVPVSEPVKDVGVLIDRFLEVQPKIGPMREVDKKVEESARMSVLEDDTLVTETMARVFAKQGQIGRARKIYKQLALKYPAKSTYFAAQLKKLGKGS